MSGFVHKAWESTDTKEKRERLEEACTKREKLEAGVFPFAISLLLVLIENSIDVRARWTVLQELAPFPVENFVLGDGNVLTEAHLVLGRGMIDSTGDPESGILHRRDFVV